MDYLVDDVNNMSSITIEVKSGGVTYIPIYYAMFILKESIHPMLDYVF